MTTDELIECLVRDTISRFNLDDVFLHATGAAIVMTAIVFFSFLGVRPDFEAAMDNGRFVFKFLFTVSLVFSGMMVLRRVGRPGVPVRAATLSLAIPFGLLAVGCVTELVAASSERWADLMIGQNAMLCLTIIPALSIGPLVCFLQALRRAAPVRPALAGAVAGLTAAAIAATFYAANCDDDSPLFVVLWYPIAIAMVAVTGAMLGHKMLHW
jgi:hypothetical protein